MINGFLKRPRRTYLRPWHALTLPMLIFLTIPVAALFLRSTPSEFSSTLIQRQVYQALLLSFSTTMVTVILTLIFGTPVAYFLANRRHGLHGVVDTLIDLPTILPPSVSGIALLLAFGRQGLIGKVFTLLGFTIPFSTAAVILAQLFIAAPLYIKTAAVGFTAVDCELRRAAAMDGANRWEIFRYIMLPMSWTSMLSGAVLTWARALGEFGATIIFAGNFIGRTQTMPLAIYIGFEIDLKVATTLSLVLVLISFLVLLVLKGILHRTGVDPFMEEV